MVRQNIPVEPDKQYRLSFFVRTENLAPGLRILIRTGTTFYVLGNFRDYIRGTVNWYRVEKIFRTPKQFGKDFRPFLEFNIGKSIGKTGKTVSAIRTILSTIAASQGRRAILEVVDE